MESKMAMESLEMNCYSYRSENIGEFLEPMKDIIRFEKLIIVMILENI